MCRLPNAHHTGAGLRGRDRAGLRSSGRDPDNPSELVADNQNLGLGVALLETQEAQGADLDIGRMIDEDSAEVIGSTGPVDEGTFHQGLP